MDKPVGVLHDPLVFAVAIWLAVAPLFLDFPAASHAATIVAWIASALMFLSAWNILVLPGVAEEWLDAAVGFGLLLSPWIFGYSSITGATLNAVGVGAVIIVCAVLAYGRDHGWHWHLPGERG